MAKRDLIEQLNQAVEAILFSSGAPPAPASPQVAELVRIATDLRDLPGEDFRQRLKEELIEVARAASAPTGKETTNMRPKPVREGFHSITPCLVVQGAARLIEFMEQAFEGQETFCMKRPDGRIQHAEVRIGDSIIELADATDVYKPMPTAIHLYVSDADTVYRRALRAGATSIGEPVDQPYGDREAGVKDPAGDHWYIATHKGPKHVPEGLRSITPYLHPRGAAKLIEFLKQAFGAEEAGRAESPDGTIVHASIRIGDSIVEMGEAHGPYQPMPTVVHLYVDDADAVYRRALEAGATSISEPADQFYGERSAGVTDPSGNAWYIATPIRDT